MPYRYQTSLQALNYTAGAYKVSPRFGCTMCVFVHDVYMCDSSQNSLHLTL